MKTTRKIYLSAVAATVIWAAFAVFIPQSKALDSLTNGIVAYWPMDTIDANTITPDLGPNSFDLLPYTGPTTTVPFTGKIGLAANAGPHQGIAGAQNGTNAMSFTNSSGAVLAYVNPLAYPIIPGANGTLPPLANPSFTLSFWVKAASGAPNTGNRIFADCDDGGGANTFYDIANDPGGTAQIDQFTRQASSTAGGVTYGSFNGNGFHVVTTNAPVFDNTWHNITIVDQVITNTLKPIIDPTQFLPAGLDPILHTPSGGQVTLTWRSASLDNNTNNAPNQVNTNQNYLVQEATNIAGPWTTIATVASAGGSLANGQWDGTTMTTYSDANATNYPNAFYRVVQPLLRVTIQSLYIDGTNYDGSLAPHPILAANVTGANYVGPFGPWHANSTAFGGFLRGAGAGGFTTALISDAAVWDRALSSAEIAAYIKDGITNIGAVTPPLSAVLASQFPSVAQNDSLILNWTATKGATLTLTPGVGDVTPVTTLGIGSTNVIVTSNTTYTLTATRGSDNTSASLPINCVSNVAANWHYIDSFTYLNNGPIGTQGGWQNPLNGVETFTAVNLQVRSATSDGNKVVSFDGYIPGTSGNGGVAGRQMLSYASVLNTTNTLFFRFYIDPSINTMDPNTGIIPDVDLNVGETDQGIRDVVDEQGGGPTGPSVRILRTGGAGGPIDLQCLDGTSVMATAGLSSSLPSFENGASPGYYSYISDTNYVTGSVGNAGGLDVGHVYDVWIDINNQDPEVSGGFGSGGTQTNAAMYTVWLQEEGVWPSRTNLFAGVINTNAIASTPIVFSGALYSGRDYSGADASFTQSTTLRTLFLDSNVNNVTEVETNSVRLDDFYISTLAGPNSTVPVTAGSFVTP